jgi:hypothetical protein
VETADEIEGDKELVKWEDSEKRAKAYLEEVGSEVDEVGKGSVKREDPDTYDQKAETLLEEHWSSTAKTDKLLEILKSVRDNDSKEKVIVFSRVYHPFDVN